MKLKLPILLALSITAWAAFLPMPALADCGAGQVQSADGGCRIYVSPSAPVTNGSGGGGTTGTASTPTQAICTDCNLGYTQLEPIPGIALTSGSNPNDPNSLINPNNLYKIINAIFTILITAGALIAVLSLTIGGIQYMTSASASLKNAGIKRAQASMWAMVLIAGTWLILHTINPALLKFSLNPCPNSNCTVNSSLSTTNSIGTGGTQSVAATPIPNATLASPTALQINDSNLNDASVKKAESDYIASCQQLHGVAIFTAGGSAGQTNMECVSTTGLY